MSSFSQPKKRTTRFSSIDSNGEINLNSNQNNDSNNNSKIQNTICHLIDLISDNDLNFFYQDNNNVSNFKHNIDQLNLRFYLETEKILSSPEGTYNNDNKLFLILFKQINLYIREIERLNSVLINQAKEPNFLKKKMVIISQKKDNFETKELLIQTLKTTLKSLEKKLSKAIQSENILKEQNEKLKKEIKYYKELYENSMGISSINVCNSQNLQKNRKSKRTYSDNNKNNFINNATINVNTPTNKNDFNLYDNKTQKKNSTSKLKIIKAVKNKTPINPKKKTYNKISNTNKINKTNNINSNSGSNRSSNIVDENGNNKTQRISINITKVSNKGLHHFHSNSNNLPKSRHDISFSMNLNHNNLFINKELEDFEQIQDLLIEIKDYFLEKCNNDIDFTTLLNENNNNNANISFDNNEGKGNSLNSSFCKEKNEHNNNKNYIIEVKPILDKSIENNNNHIILTPHFNKKNCEFFHNNLENENNE